MTKPTIRVQLTKKLYDDMRQVADEFIQSGGNMFDKGVWGDLKSSIKKRKDDGEKTLDIHEEMRHSINNYIQKMKNFDGFEIICLETMKENDYTDSYYYDISMRDFKQFFENIKDMKDIDQSMSINGWKT
ncbi:MAG: hypothetical protein ACFFCS_25185 [Candidatus Hodarchaeota archaeon]